MEKRINIFVIIRVGLGLLFIVSGGEKLIGPYQNFLYIVQSYQILPNLLEELVARFFPWIELFAGVFLALGLWSHTALVASTVMFLTFMTIVSQALIRNLPITECGCFGELISFPLPVILIFDSCMLLLTLVLWRSREKALHFSLDKYFSQE